MGRLKTLSGRDIVFILSNFGFHMASQRGSHIKLLRIMHDGAKHVLTLPLHDELDRARLRRLCDRRRDIFPNTSFSRIFIMSNSKNISI